MRNTLPHRGSVTTEAPEVSALLGALVATGSASPKATVRERARLRAIQRCVADDFVTQLRLSFRTEDWAMHPAMEGGAPAPLSSRLGALYTAFVDLDVDRQCELMDALLSLAAALVAASSTEADEAAGALAERLANRCRVTIELLNIHAELKAATLDRVLQTQTKAEIALLEASGREWEDVALRVARVKATIAALKPTAAAQLGAARARMARCRGGLQDAAAQQSALFLERDALNMKQAVLVEICTRNLVEQQEKQAAMRENSLCGGLCVSVPKRVVRRVVYLTYAALLAVGIGIAIFLFCIKGFAFIKELIDEAEGEEGESRRRLR